MFKIIGAVAVMIGALLFGTGKYNEIYERKRILGEILEGTRKIKNDLLSVCLPLHESFFNAGDFFKEAATEIKKGELPQQAVNNTVQKIRWLKQSDIDVIRRFSSGLSAYDKEGQLANIDLFIKELENLFNKSKTELETKGVLFVKGSVLLGAAIVLILI